MSLTIGRGPFGQNPSGRFEPDLPREVSYLEELPRWIRARLNAETVVDSRRPRLLHRHGRLPVYLFPEEDVKVDALPDGSVRPERGFLEVDWGAVDEWLEEEEQLVGHPRDPYSRIDVRETSRRVRVSIGGEVVAESGRAKVLYETGLPPRWYFPREDVRTDLLEESGHRTTCAYKGHADHFSAGGEDSIAWTYRHPLHDAAEVKDMMAFYDERVDVEVDGEPQERPRTQWSRD